MKTHDILFASKNLPDSVWEKIRGNAGYSDEHQARKAVERVIQKRTDAITYFVAVILFIAEAVYFRTTPAIGMGIFGGLICGALMIWSMCGCIDLQVGMMHQTLWKMESYLGYEVNRAEPYTVIELREKAIHMARAYKRIAETPDLKPEEQITEINWVMVYLGIMYESEIDEYLNEENEEEKGRHKR